MNKDYDFQWKILENTSRWVTQADTKATGLLATDAVIAGMIFTHLDKLIPIIKLGVIIKLLGIGGVFLLIASAYFALRCVTPRLAVGAPNSVIFFQHIAQMSVVDYAAKLKAVTPEEQVDHVVYQIWANSVIAVKKHRAVIYSIRFLIAAGIAFLIPLFNYTGMQL